MYRIKIYSRRSLVVVIVFLTALSLLWLWWYLIMIKMPGKSFKGELPPLTDSQIVLSNELKTDVIALADTIGERNVWKYANLTSSADYIQSALEQEGFTVTRQEFQANTKTCCNLAVEITGQKFPDEIIVIGAHYDSVQGCPGANDNASAVAAAIAIARRMAPTKADRTLRFVFFANEEPPFFQTEIMGSWVYAKSCRRRNDNIIAMLSFETMGYYSDIPGSQKYPFPFGMVYPSTGNFISFIADLGPSRKLVHRVIESFRKNCPFPSQGAAVPQSVPGIAWSDHWAFWQEGYKAIMITDTAPFRYEHYHTPSDTHGKIDYDRLARVVSGIKDVVTDLLNN